MLLKSLGESKRKIQSLLDEESDNKSPKKKRTPGKKLEWDIDDLKTAMMELNENEEIRTMLKLFREERRKLI